jgi:hypothetical protein
MKVSKHLNPRFKGSPILSTCNIDDSLWGVGTSTKETDLSLVKTELSLY